MEKLKDRHSASVHIRALGVAQVNLSGRPDTEAIAAEVQVERIRVKAARDAYEESIMRRMAATAVVNYVDSVLDATVQRLSRKVLDAADGDRKSALYSNLFNEPPGDAMRPTASPEQTRYVQRLIAHLEQGGVYAPFDSFITALTEAQAAVDIAIAKRAKCYTEEATAQTQLEMACEDARRLYNGLHARLSIMFPNDARLVESFFADL
jgi:hypothetical protein